MNADNKFCEFLSNVFFIVSKICGDVLLPGIDRLKYFFLGQPLGVETFKAKAAQNRPPSVSALGSQLHDGRQQGLNATELSFPDPCVCPRACTVKLFTAVIVAIS